MSTSTAWAIHDFALKSGTSWVDVLTLYTDDEQTELMDLTGYSANLRARRYRNADGVLDIDEDEAGGLTLGDDAGTITLEIDLTDMLGIYEYDLFLTSGDGIVYCALSGKLIIDMRVTP